MYCCTQWVSALQALSYGEGEAVCFSNFLMEMGFKTFNSVPINCDDSAGALSVASNSMFSARSWTKHIALVFFFLRELIKNRITIHHKASQSMLADIANEHLSKQQFSAILRQIKDFKY